MRPKTVRLSAAGVSPWIPLDYRATGFQQQIGLHVALSSGANLTCSVQHTMDDLQTPSRAWSFSRSSTTATGTKTNHGLSVGDYLNIAGAGAPFDGSYAVASVVDADNVTFAVLNSGLTSLVGGFAKVISARVLTHDQLQGLTAGDDGNYVVSPRGVRLYISGHTSGFADLTVTQPG